MFVYVEKSYFFPYRQLINSHPLPLTALYSLQTWLGQKTPSQPKTSQKQNPTDDGISYGIVDNWYKSINASLLFFLILFTDRW